MIFSGVLFYCIYCVCAGSGRQSELCGSRQEWSSLSTIQKETVISGFQCVQQPGTSINESTPSLSLWDDFTNVHATLNPSIHFVPMFLPWHRVYILLMELSIQSCDERFSQLTIPYWNPTVSNGTLSAWDGFDYFGFNSSVPGACLDDGPFSGLELAYPDESHCLSRSIDLSLIQEVPPLTAKP